MKNNIQHIQNSKVELLIKQLALCYSAIGFEFDDKLVDVIYDEDYRFQNYQKDATNAKNHGDIEKIVLGKNIIEYYFHEQHYSDRERFRKFDTTKDFLIWFTDEKVNLLVSVSCYEALKKRGITPNNDTIKKFIELNRVCKEKQKKFYTDKRTEFFNSKNYQELF